MLGTLVRGSEVVRRRSCLVSDESLQNSKWLHHDGDRKKYSEL
jgi:hypothetical protein